MKIKKILFILIATVALAATLAISAFAFTSYGGYPPMLPAVDYFVPAQDGTSQYRYGKTMQFENLIDDENIAQFSPSQGDVNNTVRSRWSYLPVYNIQGYRGSSVLLQSMSNNLEYSCSLYFGNMPVLDYSSLVKGGLRDIRVEPLNCDLVNNSFNAVAHDIDYMPSSEQFVLTLHYNYIDRVTYVHYPRSIQLTASQLVNRNILTYIPNEEVSSSYITYIRYVWDTSYSNATYVSFNTDGLDFLKTAFDPQIGIFGSVAFNNDVMGNVGALIEDAYDSGYQEGANDVEELLYEQGFFDYIINAVEGFLTTELFPGFSIGVLLMAIVGVSLFIWILKLFAGG